MIQSLESRSKFTLQLYRNIYTTEENMSIYVILCFEIIITIKNDSANIIFDFRFIIIHLVKCIFCNNNLSLYCVLI